jgi:hypothetical protein
MLEVENIYIDNLDDQFNVLKMKLDEIPTWTQQKHALSNAIKNELVSQGYIQRKGHKIQLFLTGGIGTSLLYKVPLTKKGMFSAYRGKIVRLVIHGSFKLEVYYFIKELDDEVVKKLMLIPTFPRDIQIKKLTQPSFWSDAVHETVLKHLLIKNSYFRKVRKMYYNYSKTNCLELELLEYYLPKNQLTDPLFETQNHRFSKGLYIAYVEISLKINNFVALTHVNEVDFEITEINSKFIRFEEWDKPSLSDTIIKNYLQAEGFAQASRSNHPELEKSMVDFLTSSHSPEIEAIKSRLKPFLLWDKRVEKQMRGLFKTLSSQSLVV